MYFIILLPEALLGMVILLILCVIWGTGNLISSFWASLLYGAFFILYIPLLAVSLLVYLVGDDEDNTTPLYVRLMKYFCTFLFPFLTMYISKKKILDKYIYYEGSDFPIRSTVLLTLVICIIIMIIFFWLICRLNIYISIVIWGAILLCSTQIRANIVEQIAKHEIVSVISFEDRKTGEIYKATGNYYYNSGMLGDITKNQVEVIDNNNEVKMIYRNSVKVSEYISRYDLLKKNNVDIDMLLKKE